jgi:hypothetical protein
MMMNWWWWRWLMLTGWWERRGRCDARCALSSPFFGGKEDHIWLLRLLQCKLIADETSLVSLTTFLCSIGGSSCHKANVTLGAPILLLDDIGVWKYPNKKLTFGFCVAFSFFSFSLSLSLSRNAFSVSFYFFCAPLFDSTYASIYSKGFWKTACSVLLRRQNHDGKCKTLTDSLDDTDLASTLLPSSAFV